ncbi:Calx-beta domain-containing protein [Leucobacter albus]|uniref:Calx-beta domain-containing protein n=1 Tax=Leucobacter albus TaxID=272210 RepID=A0ABW3TM48_9MICO
MSRVQYSRKEGFRSGGRARRVLAGIATIAMLGGLGAVGASPAVAEPAGSDLVVFADTELAACVNNQIGGRAADAPITHDDLNKLYGLSCNQKFAVTSLDGLEHAQKITNIFFAGGNHDFSATASLSAAAAMPKLNSITLTDANVSNASFPALAGVAGLSTLSLTGNPALTDLAPLAEMPKLSKLDVSRNEQLSDLSPLASSAKLRDFTASQNPQLRDLGPLTELTTLTSVSVYKTAVATLEPLSNLTELTNLSASYTEVDSLLPLQKLTKMRNLSFDYAKLESLDGIEDMADLRTLEVNYNGNIGDDIDAIRGKPELTRLHMNAIGATKLDPLFELTGLTNLQAMGNEISSRVGLQAAPASASTGSFAITAQRIPGDPKYVPKGAETYRHDATGQLANRDGSFPQPGGNLAPEPAPKLPMMNIKVFKAWPDLEYTFAEEGTQNDRFTGTVMMPIVWSQITSEDSATIPFGEEWSHEVTYTEGFPVAEIRLEPVPESKTGVPGWLKVSGSNLVGTPNAFGDWSFDIVVADALGNQLTQRFDLTVPKPGNTVFELGADAAVAAGAPAEFVVTRANASLNPFTGEASVTVETVDGTAKAGKDYTALTRTLVWAAGETNPQTVTVQTHPGKAGDDERELSLRLTNPQPMEVAELGGGFSADLTIVYPTPGITTFSISEPQIVTGAVAQPGDQPGDGEQEVEFTVQRTNSIVDPWTGEAGVSVKIYDPAATPGDDYSRTETLTWGPEENTPMTVKVRVRPGAAGDPKRLLALRLTEATPAAYAKPGPNQVTGLAIVYPEPEATVFELGEDARADAGDSVTITVTRADALLNPWTGEASVRVRTADGSAAVGTHYEAIDEVLTWGPRDAEPQSVTVRTLQTQSGERERTLVVALSEPSKFSELAERSAATVTIAYPATNPPVPGGDDGAKPGLPGGGLADSGSGERGALLAAGAAVLALLGGAGALALRRRTLR